MARRDRDALTHISRRMSEPISLPKYEEDSSDRLTPVNVQVGDGGRVIINQGSNVTLERDSSVPPDKKNSLIAALSEAFKQLPSKQKLVAYLVTLVFIAYLIASGTKLVGVW